MYEPFTKTWRLKNVGTCTWTTSYQLVFAEGDQMGAPESVNLPTSVEPGQTIDVSVAMTAPDTEGRYQGFWQLQSGDEKTFGTGSTASDHIWVKVRVAGPAFITSTPAPGTAEATLSVSATPGVAATATPSVTDDFAANACTAQWQSNDGILQCPGTDGQASGFVLTMDHAHLEDGTTATQPTLLTFPQSSPDGYILAVYPEYEVQPGDHFQATVGCEYGAAACSVLFRLSYLDAASAPHDLWTLGEFYDGKVYNLDLDLSKLAGQKVKFVLNVSALGSADGDRALWVGPRVVHFPLAAPTDTPTPLPTSTPTATPTLTPAPSATPTTVPSPTATAVPPAQPSPASQFFQGIVDFFRKLFGGK